MILEFLSPSWLGRNEELLPALGSLAPDWLQRNEELVPLPISSTPLWTPILKDYCYLCGVAERNHSGPMIQLRFPGRVFVSTVIGGALSWHPEANMSRVLDQNEEVIPRPSPSTSLLTVLRSYSSNLAGSFLCSTVISSDSKSHASILTFLLSLWQPEAYMPRACPVSTYSV